VPDLTPAAWDDPVVQELTAAQRTGRSPGTTGSPSLGCPRRRPEAPALHAGAGYRSIPCSGGYADDPSSRCSERSPT